MNSAHMTGRFRKSRGSLFEIAEYLAFITIVVAGLMLGIVGAMAASAPPRLSVDDVHTGSLLLGTDEPGRYIEAVRVGTDIDLTVSGPTIRARVTQMFRNTSKDWVEGIYVYPLSEGSAVDSMKMVIGRRVIVADIKEKQQARTIYEKARAKGQRAALMEQQRPNMFQNSVANIGPGETIVVQIEYQEPVRQADNVFSLRVPLVVAPRFSPASNAHSATFDSSGGWGNTALSGASDLVPQPPVLDPRIEAPVNPVSIRVTLRAGFALGEVSSPFHKVNMSGNDADARQIVLADGVVPADRDFELTWKAADGQAPAVGLFREKIGVDDYLLAFVTPPAGKADTDHRPRDVTFVIDNSGSMGGTSMEQAKAGLLYALGRLRPEDRFNVIRFDDTFSTMFGDSVPASEDNIAQARNFVSGLEAHGGTMMVAPMLAALRDSQPRDSQYLRQVVFMTDGEIDNEQQLFEAIAAHRGRSRLFMVGIGSAPNSHLMRRAAELGGGAVVQIGAVEQVQERMKLLAEKLEKPAMTNVDFNLTGGGDVTPRILPDLYHGETLVVLARIGSLSGNAEMSGMIDGKRWSVSLPVLQAAKGSGISKLWARRKVDDTEVSRTLGRITSEEADKRILALGLEHHIVTRLTSLVAVDRTPARPRGTPLTRADIPLNLPAGWDFDKVFGPAGESAGMREASLGKDDASGKMAAVEPVSLPQTATDAQLRLFVGLSLLLMGLAWMGYSSRKSRRAA